MTAQQNTQINTEAQVEAPVALKPSEITEQRIRKFQKWFLRAIVTGATVLGGGLLVDAALPESNISDVTTPLGGGTVAVTVLILGGVIDSEKQKWLYQHSSEQHSEQVEQLLTELDAVTEKANHAEVVANEAAYALRAYQESDPLFFMKYTVAPLARDTEQAYLGFVDLMERANSATETLHWMVENQKAAFRSASQTQFVTLATLEEKFTPAVIESEEAEVQIADEPQAKAEVQAEA